MTKIWARRGDAVVVRGSHWTSKLIAFRKRKEPGQATHILTISQDGYLFPKKGEPAALMIEARLRGGVQERRFCDVYDETTQFGLARPRNVPDEQLDEMIQWMRARVGVTKYSLWKIVLHAFGLEFLIRNAKTAICSYFHALGMQHIGYSFGVDASAADPGDCETFMRTRKQIYEWPKDCPWSLYETTGRGYSPPRR